MPSNKTLIVADLHIGSKQSQADKLPELIKKVSPKRLILLGDTLHRHAPLNSLSRQQKELLDYLLNLKQTGMDIIWIEGNHDKEINQLNIQTQTSFLFKDNGFKVWGTHGHKFDRRIPQSRIIKKLVEKLNTLGKRYRLKALYYQFSYLFYNLSESVSKQAVREGRASGADIVISAHTHKPLHKTIQGIEYFNTGSWCERRYPPSYVLIEKGAAHLHFIPNT